MCCNTVFLHLAHPIGNESADFVLLLVCIELHMLLHCQHTFCVALLYTVAYKVLRRTLHAIIRQDDRQEPIGYLGCGHVSSCLLPCSCVGPHQIGFIAGECQAFSLSSREEPPVEDDLLLELVWVVLVVTERPS